MSDETFEVPIVLWLRHPAMYVRYLRKAEGAILHGLADLIEASCAEARDDTEAK